MGASRTNCWLTLPSAATSFIHKTTGATVTWNSAQWNAKAYLKP
jgi:hypothetical protein